MFNNNEKAREQHEIEKNNEKIVDKEIEQITRHIDVENLMKFTQNIRDYREKIYGIKLELKDELEDIYTNKETKSLDDMKNRAEQDEKVKINNSVTDLIFDMKSLDKICGLAISELKFPNTKVIEMLELCEKRGTKLKGDALQYNYEDGRQSEIIEYCILLGYDLCITRDLARYVFDGPHGYDMFASGHIAKSKLNYVSKHFEGARDDRNDNLKNIQEMEKKEKATIEKIVSIRTAEILQYYEKELLYWREANLEYSIENGDNEQYFE